MLNTIMIGNKITEARKKMSISQAQLAKQLFISSQAVGKWERGESMPDIITFNHIAKILDVDLNYFSNDFPSVNKGSDSNKSSIEQAETFLSEKENPSATKSVKKHSWDMSSGNWIDADFSGLKNLQEKFSSSNMQRCKFVGCDLSGLKLKSNNIEECDFSSSDINGSHIQNSYIVNNTFIDCSMQESKFSGSYIKGCDFTEANLTEVKLESCSFIKNKALNTIWFHSSFIKTQIDDFVFGGTIDNCYFDNCSFKNVTFQNATLINTFFKGKKLKGIRFIDCQTDRITYEFLKNGKADLNGITMLNQSK